MSTPTLKHGNASRDARHVPLSHADKLRQDAAEAAEVRRWSQHPDVIALRVERIRTQIDALVWVGICLGLAFTMVNVQTFAAAGAAAWSLAWLAAWLLDPMVSLVLIAVLRAEQVTARWQVETGKWVNRTKWFAFAATYVMNTWASWVALDLAGIVLHSVPPVLVFLASESAPVLRDRLTESVTRAARMNTDPAADTGEQHGGEHLGELAPVNTAPAHATNTPANGGSAEQAAADDRPTVPIPPVPAAPAPATRAAAAPRRSGGNARRSSRQASGQAGKQAGGRLLAADYLAIARRDLGRDTEVSPAWVREVTGCSRGLSSQLARDLAAEQAAMTNHTNQQTEQTAGQAAERGEAGREAA